MKKIYVSFELTVYNSIPIILYGYISSLSFITL